jgi:hypothetical protein
MRDRQIVTFEVDAHRTSRSLHDFIHEVVNPLIDSGWSVDGLSISSPLSGNAPSPKLEVILGSSAAVSGNLAKPS